MTACYRERLYLHSWVYLLWGASVLVVALWFSQAARSGGSTELLYAVSALGLLALGMLLAGCMVVTVDHAMLVVSFGWLGVLRKAFPLSAIKAAHICLENVPFAHLGRAYHAPAGGRRGVSIKHHRKRWFIRCSDPLRLKSAVTKREAIVNEMPEYRRHDLMLEQASRRQLSGHSAALQL